MPRKLSELTIHSDDESSENSSDWTFPHLTYINKLYDEMVD